MVEEITIKIKSKIKIRTRNTHTIGIYFGNKINCVDPHFLVNLQYE